MFQNNHVISKQDGELIQLEFVWSCVLFSASSSTLHVCCRHEVSVPYVDTLKISASLVLPTLTADSNFALDIHSDIWSF
jgi:hypothetical protein